MLSWHELPRASFDLETTGRDPQLARIVTASIILGDGAGDVLTHHEWLVDPGVEIPHEAAAIHGISTEKARSEGLPAAEAVRQISDVLADMFAAGIPVLAFNAAYDFTVLAREAERHGCTAPVPFPVIDPYIMDKRADRFRRGKRTLTAMAEHYSVAFENAHTSAADVMATLAVGAAVARSFPELALDAATLHARQLQWAAEQAASFQAYLRRRDPGAVIDGTWPVKPAAPDTAALHTPPQTVPAMAALPAEAVPVLAEEADGQLVLELTPR
ncbi:MAG: 3'-5' exonuclease [Arthrobacter sp.]